MNFHAYGKTGLLAASIILSMGSASFAAPKVVASIKPVHSLVSMVMGDLGAPTLLVAGGDSPHTYSLRPSDAQALSEADLVVLVDSDRLELFLDKPLDSLASRARELDLADTDGTTRLALREGGLFEAHHHDDDDDHDHESDDADDHDDDHGHDDDETDAHYWLDPDNALVWLDAIARELTEIDPANAATYAENAKQAGIAIASLKAEIAATMRPVQGKSFIVFHDAYHYFENRFGIAAAGSITVSPETAPGAARISEIHQKLTQAGAVCVFTEPQFPPRIVTTVTEGTGARTGELDPLGAALADGPTLYPELLRGLAADLVACLGAN